MTHRDDLLRQLRTYGERAEAAIERAYNAAALKALEAAQEATPPLPGNVYGVNTITGNLRGEWALERRADGFHLTNNVEYASYVNDGHRLARHFVPGLYIDENGVLSRDLTRPIGMVVGTQTQYVEGKHMTDKAQEAFSDALTAGLQEALNDIRNQ